MTFSLASTPFNRLWNKFSKSKTAREQFVAGYVKRSIPTQIRHLMKQRRLTQFKLAEQAGLTQGVISRAADVSYGDLTLNTIVRIAAGFDCAFVGKYVPFSEFLRDVDKQIDVDVATFEDEKKEHQDIAAKSDISEGQGWIEKETAAGLSGPHPDLASKEEKVIPNDKMSNELFPKRPQPDVGTLSQSDSEKAA